MGYYWSYAPYVSVGEKRAKAARQLEKLKKKDPHIRPVILEGNRLAGTWWGKSWNQNLEGYADYSNRIGRGRSYVRHGSVLDLKIKPREVSALVQGTASRPYSVSVKIKGIEKSTWKGITAACQGKFDSLPELLEGRFPKGLGEILTARGKGLFPSPKEIEFSCSCPDWASMCKHVAATLYGIGARLDEDPLLFFTLRNANVHDLISEAVEDKTRSLLQRAGRKTARVMDDIDLTKVFGIEMEEQMKPRAARASNRPAKPAKVKSTRRTAAKSSTVTKNTIRTGKQAKGKAALRPSVTDRVGEIIKKSRRGVTLEALEKKTGFDKKKLYNILFRLKRQGRAARTEKGVYIRPT